jgi:hypothetical protein
MRRDKGNFNAQRWESFTMREIDIQDYARQLLAAHGDKAQVEAAQKARAFEDAGKNEDASDWRHIEAAIKMMRGPKQS